MVKKSVEPPLFPEFYSKSGVGRPFLKVKSFFNYTFLPIRWSEVFVPFIFIFPHSPASSAWIRTKESTTSGSPVDLEFLGRYYTQLDDVTVS